MVTINKKRQNKPPSILEKARHFYMDTMCNCARLENGGIVNCTIPQTATVANNLMVSSSRSNGHDDDEDLHELIRLAVSSKKGGGTRVEVDSKGNLVWRNSVAVAVADGRSYSAGVGRMGRIDEGVACEFKEADVTKIWYTRSLGIHERSNIN